MVEIFGANIPISTKFNIFGGSFGLTVSLILFIIMIIILGAVGIWLIYYFKVYNRKIIVFENVSGYSYQPTFKDRARLVRLGDGGEEILYLRKKKVFRTAYGRKMGKNAYWFAVGQDGYWYNFVLGDLDAKMGMLDIEPIDRDMRYMHVAIRRNIQERYKNKKTLTATTIVVAGVVVVVLIMMIGNWFILKKIAEINTATTKNVDASTDLVQAAEGLVNAIANLEGGTGSGLRSAGG